MAREKRAQRLDTEDHLTERVMEAAAWADRHRRVVILGGIALVAVVAAAFYYQDYRQKLVERASVRFQELQLSAQSADLETVRAELGLFVDQYPGTTYASQARVVLADLELRRDSLRAAIATLEPVADLGSGNPLAFTAAEMIAAAYEQGGDDDRALEWYQRIESEARFDYQRHFALSAQARLHTAAGRYSEAIAAYETLIEEIEEDPAGQEIYRLRLGEVQALSDLGSAPPLPPVAQGAPPAAEPQGAPAAEAGNETEAEPGSEG